MMDNIRTTKQVLQEKYEERGWDQDSNIKQFDVQENQITALPLTKEEYNMCSLSIAKLALQDQDAKLCQLYFDLQRRAIYGNHYYPTQDMSDLEKEMWNIGQGETNKSNSKLK